MPSLEFAYRNPKDTELGIPAYGNQRSEWDAGCRFGSESPDYR